jgi:hypothetical protein
MFRLFFEIVFLASVMIGTVAYCQYYENRILNDVKDVHEPVRFEQCPYCGCISFYGTGCLDDKCPGSK